MLSNDAPDVSLSPARSGLSAKGVDVHRLARHNNELKPLGMGQLIFYGENIESKFRKDIGR